MANAESDRAPPPSYFDVVSSGLSESLQAQLDRAKVKSRDQRCQIESARQANRELQTHVNRLHVRLVEHNETSTNCVYVYVMLVVAVTLLLFANLALLSHNVGKAVEVEISRCEGTAGSILGGGGGGGG